ncbi:MAG: alpha/beta hydrolase [Pseudomonadota bacterium]
MKYICNMRLSLFAALLSFGAGSAGAVDLDAGGVVLDTGVDLAYEQGAISVPEVREKEGSRQISVGFWRIAKAEGASGDPVFLLAGGPGGSYPERIEEGGYRQKRYMRVINMYRRVGDVVLVDLRGVNLSTPNTVCNGAPNKWRRANSEEAFYDIMSDAGRACREKLISEGFDLSGYVVTEAAADVIAVADALGYDKINVAGTSFGSHWGVTLAKYYSDRISHILLTGLEGLDHTVDDRASVALAIKKISEAARPTWNGAYGHEGPAEALVALAERADRSPKEAFGLRRYEIAETSTSGRVYGLSGRGGMYEWPAAVHDYMDGKVGFFRLMRWFMARTVSKGWDAAAVGMFDCASWISPERRARFEAQDWALAPDNLKYHDALCAGWGVEPLPDDFRADFQSDVPALFIHGTLDVSTPLANAEETIKLFPNGTLTIVEGGSHGVLTESLNEFEGLEDRIVDWFYGGTPPSQRLSLPPVSFKPID